MELPPIVGRLVGDTSHFDREMRQADDTTGRLTKGMGGLKSAVGLVGGAFAAVGAQQFLSGAIDEFEEATKVGRQTEAVIKSTGGAANVTAAEVDRLATSLSNKAGIDDEAIASGQNMLLTFTKIRNEVGEGNDIFNQASKAALDMSVAMGTDMSQAAIQVGKALNDPIAGVGALRRVGVQLTDQQEESIKTMVEQGDIMGAQKVILKELTTQFGGSAEAQATGLDKLRVKWGNFKEAAGGAIANLADKVLPKLEPVLKNITGGLKGFFEAREEGVTSDGFIGWMERMGVVAFRVVDQVKKHWPQIKDTIMNVVQAVVGFVQQNWPRIKEIITEALETIKTVIGGWVTFVMTIWNNFGSQITDVIKSAWDFIADIVDAALNIIRGIIQVVTGLIKGDWGMVWEGIKAILSGAWDAIKAIVSTAIDFVKEIISVGWEIVKGIFTGAWDALKGIVSEAWDGIKSLISGGIETVIGWVAAMPGRIASAAAGMWDGIKDAFRSAINWIIRAWNNFGIPGFSLDLELPGPIPDIHFSWGGLSLPDIPLLDSGGIVTKPTLAMLAGNSRPEAVVPLDRLGGSGPIVVQLVVDGRVLAEVLADPMREQLQRKGSQVGESNLFRNFGSAA